MKISQNKWKKTIFKKKCLVYREKKRKQKGGAIPFGLIPSFAAPILGEVAKRSQVKFLVEVAGGKED